MKAPTAYEPSHFDDTGIVRVHFVNEDEPEIGRFAPDELIELRQFMLADIRGVRNAPQLIAVIYGAIGPVPTIGWNWDALDETLRDFECGKRPLVIAGAESILRLKPAEGRSFIAVLESAVSFRRDWLQGDSDERPRGQLHVVLIGSSALREFLERHMQEPLCRHGATGTDVTWLPGGLGTPSQLDAIESFVKSGASFEFVAAFLTSMRLSHGQTLYVLAHHFGMKRSKIREQLPQRE